MQTYFSNLPNHSTPQKVYLKVFLVERIQNLVPLLVELTKRKSGLLKLTADWCIMRYNLHLGLSITSCCCCGENETDIVPQANISGMPIKSKEACRSTTDDGILTEDTRCVLRKVMEKFMFGRRIRIFQTVL